MFCCELAPVIFYWQQVLCRVVRLAWRREVLSERYVLNTIISTHQQRKTIHYLLPGLGRTGTERDTSASWPKSKRSARTIKPNYKVVYIIAG